MFLIPKIVPPTLHLTFTQVYQTSTPMGFWQEVDGDKEFSAHVDALRNIYLGIYSSYLSICLSIHLSTIYVSLSVHLSTVYPSSIYSLLL